MSPIPPVSPTRIAIFGGSFDPPHRGHQLLVEEVLTNGIVHQVWLLPCGQHAFSKALSPTKVRWELLEAFMEDIDSELKNQVQLLDTELRRPGPSYSLHTLRELRNASAVHNGNQELSLLIGADQLPHFHRWQGYQDLLHEFPILVYPRAGYDAKPLRPGMRLLSELPSMQVSSTEIRQLLSTTENERPKLEAATASNPPAGSTASEFPGLPKISELSEAPQHSEIPALAKLLTPTVLKALTIRGLYAKNTIEPSDL